MGAAGVPLREEKKLTLILYAYVCAHVRVHSHNR